MDAFGKITAIILAIILLYIFPSIYMAQKQDSIIQTYVLNETANFVDTVKNTGKITKTLYEGFIKKLDATGNIYNIEIEHKHYEIIPNIDENDIDEYYYTTYETSILDCLYPDSDTEGIYIFNQGDLISVKVTNKNKTYATRLQETLYQRFFPTEQIIVTYGGAIRDETD